MKLMSIPAFGDECSLQAAEEHLRLAELFGRGCEDDPTWVRSGLLFLLAGEQLSAVRQMLRLTDADSAVLVHRLEQVLALV